MLPVNYDARSVQQEINKTNESVRTLSQFIPMIPLSYPPVEALAGYLAMSNGTGGGFNGSSGAGLYRYTGSTWAFVG
tara:strand:- start:689 stop:919 length:231 start_codon:yes stop_codon:yes gene_type:complete